MAYPLLGIFILIVLSLCYKSIIKGKRIHSKQNELNEVKSESEELIIDQEIALEREYQKDIEKQIKQINGEQDGL